jgi:hypothetical protein
VSRSPLVVLWVVGALGAVFAGCTTVLIRREERRDVEPEPPRTPAARPPDEPSVARPRPPRALRVRTPKPSRARTSKTAPVPTPDGPHEAVPPEPRAAGSEPDPRRPSLVENLDAFTAFRSR